MPKMKTKSGAKKRFRFTASGKVKHGVVGKRHGMTKRGNRFLRQQTGMTLVSEPDTRIGVARWIPEMREMDGCERGAKGASASASSATF